MLYFFLTITFILALIALLVAIRNISSLHDFDFTLNYLNLLIAQRAIISLVFTLCISVLFSFNHIRVLLKNLSFRKLEIKYLKLVVALFLIISTLPSSMIYIMGFIWTSMIWIWIPFDGMLVFNEYFLHITHFVFWYNLINSFKVKAVE